MLPAGPCDRSSLEGIVWNIALRLKQSCTITVDFNLGREYDQNDVDSCFRPSFTLCCDHIEARQKLIAEGEEMVIVLEQSMLCDESACDTRLTSLSKNCSEHITIERFLAKSFRNVVAPLSVEICKKIVPGICQSVCQPVDLFDESDRQRSFSIFGVNRCSILIVSPLIEFRWWPINGFTSNQELCDRFHDKLRDCIYNDRGSCQEKIEMSFPEEIQKKTYGAEVRRFLIHSSWFWNTFLTYFSLLSTQIQCSRLLLIALTDFLIKIFDAVSRNKCPALALTIPSNSCNVDDFSGATSPKCHDEIHLVILGKNYNQSRTFSRFVKVLQVVYSLLKLGKVSTKRGLAVSSLKSQPHMKSQTKAYLTDSRFLDLSNSQHKTGRIDASLLFISMSLMSVSQRFLFWSLHGLSDIFYMDVSLFESQATRYHWGL